MEFRLNNRCFTLAHPHPTLDILTFLSLANWANANGEPRWRNKMPKINRFFLDIYGFRVMLLRGMEAYSLYVICVMCIRSFRQFYLYV